MPVPVTAPVDNPSGPQGGEDGALAPGTDKANESYLGTWKTKEDAEKGVKESQAKITQLAEENKSLREKTQIVDTLEKISQRLEKPESSDSEMAARREALKQSLVERIKNGSDEDIVDVMLELQYGLENDVNGRVSEREKALMAEIKSLKDSFSAMSITQSDDYRTHKAQVDAMMASGAVSDIQQAIKLAKALEPIMPDPMRVPAGTGDGVGSVGRSVVSVPEEEVTKLLQVLPSGTTRDDARKMVQEYHKEKAGRVA